MALTCSQGFGRAPVTILVVQVCSRYCSIHVLNLIDKLSAAKERRLNQFGTADIVNLDRVCCI